MFIKLTGIDGEPVWVRADSINTIGRYKDHTLVNSGAVREEPAIILAAIAEAEGAPADGVTDEMVDAGLTGWYGSSDWLRESEPDAQRADMYDALTAALKARRP